MGIVNFFRNLFRCQTCEVLLSELEEYRKWHDRPCSSCEILKVELENERLEKRKLLDKLLFPPEPKPDLNLETEYKPVLPRHTPWSIRQAMLEREDRERAKVLAEFAAMERNANPVKPVSELEKELLTTNDVPRGESGGVIAQVEPLTEEDFEEVNAS
jgi:hypothetical protein